MPAAARVRSWVGAVALLAVATAAPAQTYQLAWAYNGQFVPEQGTVAVPAGTGVVLDLYLRQLTAGPAPSVNTVGLSTFAARVGFGTPGVLGVPVPDPSAALAYAPGFEPYTQTAGTSNPTGFRAAAFSLGSVPAADSAVRLVSVTFDATAGSTDLTAADVPLTDDWFLGNDDQLDGSPNLIQPTRIVVTPVPEPGLAVLAAAAGLAAVSRRTRPASGRSPRPSPRAG